MFSETRGRFSVISSKSERWDERWLRNILEF